MDFSNALVLLKSGKKLTRRDWNGKNLSVVLQKGYPDGIPANKQTSEVWGIPIGSLFKCGPYFQINTVDGSYAMWFPTVTDLLADDWSLVENTKIAE